MKIEEKVVINNTLFVLCDVIESLMLDAEKLYKADGQEFKQQSKRDFKATLFTLRRFLGSVRECTPETQMQFGDDADEMKHFIMKFVDRCNDDQSRVDLFMKYLNGCSSLLNFDFKKINI
jgi:hypothetical protein